MHTLLGSRGLLGIIEKRHVMVETLAQIQSIPRKAIFGASALRLFMFYAIISRTNCTLPHKFVVYCLTKSHFCNRPIKITKIVSSLRRFGICFEMRPETMWFIVHVYVGFSLDLIVFIHFSFTVFIFENTVCVVIPPMRHCTKQMLRICRTLMGWD